MAFPVDPGPLELPESGTGRSIRQRWSLSLVSLLTYLGRGLRLRCPRCGEGRLFSGWFQMHPRCDGCGLPFRREPGFYLGSIYVNYGLTALVVTTVYVGAFILTRSGVVAGDAERLLWPLAAFTLLFPLWFFRYARGVWLGFDEFLDPHRPKPPREPAETPSPSEVP